jgi:hypothetical protein
MAVVARRRNNRDRARGRETVGAGGKRKRETWKSVGEKNLRKRGILSTHIVKRTNVEAKWEKKGKQTNFSWVHLL